MRIDIIPVFVYIFLVLPTEGRLPETDRRWSGMRRLRAGLVILHSGGVGAPPGRPLRAARQELADDPGKCPDESAARRRDKNAAVKRRKARRRASFAGGLRRSADRPDP